MIVMIVISMQMRAKLHFNDDDDGAVYGDDDGDDSAGYDGYSNAKEAKVHFRIWSTPGPSS